VVDVLVILDGASEPCRAGPTSLEAARTPVLDALAHDGTIAALRTVPDGLPAGSETAIPLLLGWAPTAPVDRGALEAAAHEVDLAEGERAWRVDVADERRVDEAIAMLRADAPEHRVLRLAGHRLLLCGRPPLPAAACRAGLRPWAEGAVPPRVLDERTTVVAARGAAAGAARLMGARVVHPPGATGMPDSDFGAKAVYARAAIAAGAERVVVHVGAPDEAAHRRDRALKIAAIERADREILGPLAGAVGRAGGRLRVCPDHGCDPETGEHDGAPVPCLTWPARDGLGRRLTERRT
jgi:2,3-bisphosphoglycerate-independent phosphoglycerate mutase